VYYWYALHIGQRWKPEVTSGEKMKAWKEYLEELLNQENEWITVLEIKRFWWYKIKKLLKVAYSFSRSFSTDTHREKTSVCRFVGKGSGLRF